ncbi:MAG: hypothetical protein KA712_08175 [Myxococcales bacterium]|nr:hypothetical protein [Myxococcales bacterium]
MDHSVEIITLERGVRQSARTLSQRVEHRAGGYAASVAAGVSALGFVGFALATWAGGFVLHAPVFFGTAAVGVAAAASWAWRRTVGRAQRYRIGARVEDDAFSSQAVDLVRRSGEGYDLALVQGMSGVIEEPGMRRPVEGLTVRDQVVCVPIVPGQVARIDLDQTTFLVRGLDGTEAAQGALALAARPLALPGLQSKTFVRAAVTVTTAAALLPLSTAIAKPQQLATADLASGIPSQATPWEVEKLTYKAVQRQSEKLYACFEPFPAGCGTSGFVGVGLRLSQQGDVREHWVSRSTYGASCPVAACVEQVVAELFFEPMPEPLTVIVPVQVLANPLARRGAEVQVGGAWGLRLESADASADLLSPSGGVTEPEARL